METLVVERRGGVVTVTMDRPERKNAANRTMMDELQAAFEAVARSADDRVVVLTGAGGAFCSGADLADGDVSVTGSGSAIAYMRRLGDVALALRRLTKPVIAKVDGVAYGAGLSLALGCDLVVASQRARLSMVFARRGLSLDLGASWLLPRLVGLARAKEIALLGDEIPLADARAMGLVNRVVPLDQLDAAVDEWASRLAAGPTLALSMTKMLLEHGMQVSLEQAVEDEARCQAVNFTSEDTTEALRAFRQRRAPRFTGR